MRRSYALLIALLLALILLSSPEGGTTLSTAPRPVRAEASEPDTLELLLSTPRPVRDPVDLVTRLSAVPPSWLERAAGPRTPVQTPTSASGDSQLAVGRADSFFVLDQTDNSYRPREAELRLVTSHVYWYVERGQGVNQEDLERSASHFEEQTYPTVHRYFGSEWSPGIDGDPRISIFMGSVPGVAAYFSSWDEYPRAIYSYSNEREMVHLNVGTLRPGSAGFDSTLAHEFQHMVHWNVNPAEETWVDEGSAELASSLVVPRSATSVSQFQRQPDIQLTGWAQSGATGAHYQAAFLFMQYFSERYGGPNGLRELFAERGRPPDTFDRYLARAGFGVTFDDVFGDWVVANLLDNPSLENGRYLHQGSDPTIGILTRLQPDGTRSEDSVRQYGADYIELVGDGRDAELLFEGNRSVRLVGADATSGRKLWWGNRGDGLDTSMTRRFDLQGLAAASLRFNLWYETEKDFDFFYVMASSDGGLSWQVLHGGLASDVNPTGNAVGPGYSGRSGSGGPAWVSETVDLTPFVGGDVLIRFEYVTDQAFNMRGVLLDDIAIPEIGYLDDGETDTGWTSEGFIQSDNVIPQSWGLRLVEYRRDGTIAVRQLALAEDQTLVERLPSFGGEVERAVLTVSGLAPRTLEPASYRVTLRPGS